MSPQTNDKLRRIKLLMTLSTLLFLAASCTTVQLNNSERLIERHPAGFTDAVNASTNATEFVRDALKTINRLESVIERQ